MAQIPPVLQKFIDKFSNSRDFTISFTIHVILVAVFGGTVLFQAVSEPPDFEGESGGFVAEQTPNTPPPQQVTPQQTTFTQTTVNTPPAPSMAAITTTAPSAIDFSMSPTMVTPVTTAPSTQSAAVAPPPTAMANDGMSQATASQIKAFTGGWGKGSGPGSGVRNREFEFTAYIGQYAGGNWSSTIKVNNGKIERGSLPNLLYYMSFASKDKIKTNYKNVKAIKLDSDELFSIKPPFIFMTGTRDFKLSDKEVENLQKYVRLGGCIWGDSSVPGLRSRFDLAFRREMKRVIPDVDKDFEALPPTHAIYTQTYFPDVKEVPAGLNYYKLPVFALKIYGEVAIIYTPNDYGDMWQIGLNDQGKIDNRKDLHQNYVAVNQDILKQRDVYIRNLNVEALNTTYKFGTNMVIHLLTRWENKTRTAPTLPGGI